MATKKLKRVSIYFENKNQEKVYNKILKLHKKTGMSLSRLGYLSLLYGLPQTAEAVTGVYLDAEVQSVSQEQETPQYVV